MTVEEATTPITEVETVNLFSVTTLIKMALGVGDPLVNWACRFTAEKAIDARTTIDAMLKDEGREAAVTWLAEQRRRRTTEAGVRGTEVHSAAEKLALGQDVGPIDPQRLPYVQQLSSWLEAFQPTYLLAECPVYNVSHGYAGTCDGVMELQGQRLLFDYKTTDKGPNEGRSRPPYSEVALQLVAYRRAEMVGVLAEQRYTGRSQRYYVYDPTVEHEPMPQVDGAICIVISPEDCFAQVIRTDEHVWEAFRYVQQVAAWQDDLSYDVLKAVLPRPRRES